MQSCLAIQHSLPTFVISMQGYITFTCSSTTFNLSCPPVTYHTNDEVVSSVAHLCRLLDAVALFWPATFSVLAGTTVSSQMKPVCVENCTQSFISSHHLSLQQMWLVMSSARDFCYPLLDRFHFAPYQTFTLLFDWGELFHKLCGVYLNFSLNL